MTLGLLTSFQIQHKITIPERKPLTKWTFSVFTKLWSLYIYNGILFSHKKNEILPFAAK